VGSNPVQNLKFFQVIFPVVLWLHSHLSFFQNRLCKECVVQFREKKDYISLVNTVGLFRGYSKCEPSPGSESSCVAVHPVVAKLLQWLVCSVTPSKIKIVTIQ